MRQKQIVTLSRFVACFPGVIMQILHQRPDLKIGICTDDLPRVLQFPQAPSIMDEETAHLHMDGWKVW